MSNEDEFEKDREVIEAATDWGSPAPWVHHGEYDVRSKDGSIVETDDPYAEPIAEFANNHDAQFIARARERWPAVLDEKVHAKKLQRLLDEMRECHVIEWEARSKVETERDRLRKRADELEEENTVLKKRIDQLVKTLARTAVGERR